MTTRSEVIAEARRWIGTPFHHQAAVCRVGCDCIGLIGGVAIALGISGGAEWRDRPEYHNYAKQPDPRLLLRACDEFLNSIAIEEATLADILLMRFEQDPMHFSLISSVWPPRVIHALSRLGYVAEHGSSEILGGQIMRAYSFRGVT
jgi:NlpC/P60 family putative phage cell wall peptidase